MVIGIIGESCTGKSTLADNQERFAQRMKVNLPAPVATLLERKHGCFDTEKCDIHVVSGQPDLDAVCAAIQKKVEYGKNER